MSEWIKKFVAYIHNGILFHNKNEILLVGTTSKDLESIILSEMSHREEDKYCMVSLICGM